MSTVRSASSGGLFPNQGDWTEEEYLALPGNRLIEFSDGHVEVLPMPTEAHQFIVAYLYRVLHGFVLARSLGRVLFAGLAVRLRSGKFREPDVLFLAAEHRERSHGKYWDPADLVMEVVSENDPERDWEVKRAEYAKAGIPEYWIVDPHRQQIVILQLNGGKYAVHGEFAPGQIAASHLLQGFNVDVAACLAAAD
ncbi:MAG TPA: Uma2 family endonuclease [Tepidisphaeraceae bacterium]|jgi:Uma2 family endonuclease